MKCSPATLTILILNVLLIRVSYAYVDNIHDLVDLKDTELVEIYNNPYGDPSKIPGEDRPGVPPVTLQK